MWPISSGSQVWFSGHAAHHFLEIRLSSWSVSLASLPRGPAVCLFSRRPPWPCPLLGGTDPSLCVPLQKVSRREVNSVFSLLCVITWGPCTLSIKLQETSKLTEPCFSHLWVGDVVQSDALEVFTMMNRTSKYELCWSNDFQAIKWLWYVRY